MKKYFKKAIAILGSALMISSSAALAIAANYPTPFNSGAAIVVGANAALSDGIAANTISTGLGTSEGGGVTVVGDAWEVGTTSDSLEIGESITDTLSYLGTNELSILENGEIINEKGTATYKQYLYFEDTVASMVNYTKNDNDDTIGDFLLFKGGDTIARYVIDFTKSLKTDLTAAGVLEDVQNEEIKMLGKTYTITTATNDSDGDVTLVLMSGANSATIDSGEEITLGGYTISATVISSTEVRFVVNGQTVPNSGKMASGEIEPITGTSDFIAVTDISYQGISGGLAQTTFWIGADKIQLVNNSNIEVNGESISNTAVRISHTVTGGDMSISEIFVNMTADDDIYVPKDGKLSETILADGDDPGVLLTKNWDIEFKGFEEQNEETIKLDVTGSDKKYKLTFDNYDGDTIDFYLFHANDTGIYPGESASKRLILAPNAYSYLDGGVGSGIRKNDFFILNTANPQTSGGNARSYVVQYKSSDETDSSSAPVAKFEVLGSKGTITTDVSTTAATSKRISLSLSGSTFYFDNITSGDADDFKLNLTSSAYTSGAGTNATMLSAYIRTRYNTLINITDKNWSAEEFQTTQSTTTNGVVTGNWVVNISVDDTNRDDDETILTEQIVAVTFSNTSGDGDVGTTITKTPSTAYASDPDDNTITTARTRYGALIEISDPSGAPESLTITVPEEILRPLVYVSSGAISVSGGTGAVGNAIVIYDNEISSMADKSIIVVGGSCINTVAAKLLGSSTPVCTSAFTELTGIEAGQALIQVFDAADAGGTAGKTALLVAGYNAPDTTKATTYLINQVVDTTVGTKLKVTSTTEATAITE